MIENSQLRKFLENYADDSEVIIIGGGDKKEIKHVGMARSISDDKYKVVLATERPTHCCNICGENVYRSNNAWFCVTCNCHRYINEISKL